MATDTEGEQSSKVRPEPDFRIELNVFEPLTEADGPWLQDVGLWAFWDNKCVAELKAKLIKEHEYTSATRHFYSAMDDQGTTMGDLAELLLHSERRWGYVREDEDKTAVRERLDKETQREHWKPKVHTYCAPVLFKPRPRTSDHVPFPTETQWVLYFTEVSIASRYRGRGIGRGMVKIALAYIRALAQQAHRPFLAAVEPEWAQMKRAFVNDPSHFRQLYGSMERHYNDVYRIMPRPENAWLELGFQKLEKPLLNPRLKSRWSNFFFWSGYFDLPVCRGIDLSDHGEHPPSSAPLNGSMTVPKEKKVLKPIGPKKIKLKGKQKAKEPMGPDQDVDIESNKSKSNGNGNGNYLPPEQALDNSVIMPGKIHEKRARPQQDVDMVFSSQINGKRIYVPQGAIRDSSTPSEQRPEKRPKLDHDVGTDSSNNLN